MKPIFYTIKNRFGEICECVNLCSCSRIEENQYDGKGNQYTAFYLADGTCLHDYSCTTVYDVREACEDI